MLGFLFGFNARLGRLHYFFASLALAGVMTLVCFAIATYGYVRLPNAAELSAIQITWPVLTAVMVFGWVSFSLSAMRIRDIGWDPVCVIPVWFAILALDKVVAGKIPAWAVGHDHNGTVVGALFNLALYLALAFWPGGTEAGATPPPLPNPRRSRDEPGERRGSSVPAERLARATGDFGRRA